MKPGMWSSFLVDQSPEEMVVTFAEKGWYDLELSTEHGAKLLERGEPQATGQRFRKFAAEHGVAIPQGHLWLRADIAGPEQAQVVEALKRWLELFAAVGIRAAVVHPGGAELARQGVDEEEISRMRTEALRTLADHVRDPGVVICLENGAGADVLCEMIEAADRPNLGICLDTGHLNLAGGDQAAFIRTAGPLLKALHIADNDGTSDQHLMPYGRGTVRWPDVTAALKALAYEGLFNFEIPGENKCPLPVRLAKLDYLKAILPVLLGEAETRTQEDRP